MQVDLLTIELVSEKLILPQYFYIFFQLAIPLRLNLLPDSVLRVVDKVNGYLERNYTRIMTAFVELTSKCVLCGFLL